MKKNIKPRNVTRNPSRNPLKTRETILETAQTLFAASGFHGTGVNDICKKARINKRMIYHYFGDKEALYLAVHRRGWEELGAWFVTKLAGGDTKNNLLLEALGVFHDFIASRQIFVRLLMWDGLEGGKASRALWTDMRGPIYRQLESLVTTAQNDGLVPKDLKAGHLIISFMGAIAFYFSHAHTMVDIFHKDPLSPGAVVERKDQILSLFRKLMGPTAK
jgi:AcrR family transcriptional regulator